MKGSKYKHPYLIIADGKFIKDEKSNKKIFKIFELGDIRTSDLGRYDDLQFDKLEEILRENKIDFNYANFFDEFIKEYDRTYIEAVIDTVQQNRYQEKHEQVMALLGPLIKKLSALHDFKQKAAKNNGKTLIETMPKQTKNTFGGRYIGTSADEIIKEDEENKKYLYLMERGHLAPSDNQNFIYTVLSGINHCRKSKEVPNTSNVINVSDISDTEDTSNTSFINGNETLYLATRDKGFLYLLSKYFKLANNYSNLLPTSYLINVKNLHNYKDVFSSLEKNKKYLIKPTNGTNSEGIVFADGKNIENILKSLVAHSIKYQEKDKKETSIENTDTDTKSNKLDKINNPDNPDNPENTNNLINPPMLVNFTSNKLNFKEIPFKDESSVKQFNSLLREIDTTPFVIIQEYIQSDDEYLYKITKDKTEQKYEPTQRLVIGGDGIKNDDLTKTNELVLAFAKLPGYPLSEDSQDIKSLEQIISCRKTMFKLATKHDAPDIIDMNDKISANDTLDIFKFCNDISNYKLSDVIEEIIENAQKQLDKSTFKDVLEYMVSYMLDLTFIFDAEKQFYLKLEKICKETSLEKEFREFCKIRTEISIYAMNLLSKNNSLKNNLI